MSVAASTVTGMTTTTTRRTGIRTVPLPSGLVRVTRASGEVLGYVEQRVVRDQLRYIAKRMRPADTAFLELGMFWSDDDAIDALVFS